MTNDTEEQPDTRRLLTGWHVLTYFLGGFAVIIGVNLYMAAQAVMTFPGMEVSSSYADSQTFNDRRAAQEALGWQASVIAENGQVALRLVDAAGRPVYPAELTALLTRPTTRVDDQELVLTREPGGLLTAPADLAPGRWRLRLTGLAANGVEYRHNITFTLADME